MTTTELCEITLADILKLKPGDILYDQCGKRWKVNGQVKRWVRDPNRFRVPLKHGLYSYDFIDSSMLREVGGTSKFVVDGLRLPKEGEH